MRSIFLLFVLVAFFSSQAQSDYLVNNLNDTIYGKITFPKSDGVEKLLIKNEDGKDELSVGKVLFASVKGESYRRIRIGDQYKMMKVEVSGFLSFLRFRNEGEFEFSGNYLLKKSGESIAVTSIGFRKKAAKFLVECQQLVEELEAKKYSYRQIDEVVSRYNQLCVQPQETVDTTQQTMSFEDLSEFQSALKEVLTKLENNEPIPEYLKDVIAKFANLDMNERMKELLEAINQ